MRQICNLVYADLRRGRNRVELAELEQALAPPEEKERALDKMNRESMASLGVGMIAPPPRK